VLTFKKGEPKESVVENADEVVEEGNKLAGPKILSEIDLDENKKLPQKTENKNEKIEIEQVGEELKTVKPLFKGLKILGKITIENTNSTKMLNKEVHSKENNFEKDKKMKNQNTKSGLLNLYMKTSLMGMFCHLNLFLNLIEKTSLKIWGIYSMENHWKRV
jgi:hypothetical protein